MGKQLQVRTLGALQIQIDDQPVTGFDSRKVLALLVYLACTGRTFPREVLAEMLWEERTQAQALANLRVALHSLNQTVGEYVETPRETVGLNSAAEVWLDARAFETQLSAAGNNVARLEVALDLYQGDFLSGFFVDSGAFEQWATVERERLRLRAVDGLDALITAHLAAANYPEGIRRATQLVQMDALREKAHRQLMELLWRSGEREAALAQYETCRRVLKADLGIDPTPETNHLAERIRAGQPPDKPHTPAVRGYQLHSPLGEGGFGEVYRAYQPIGEREGREVAIKVIKAEYANHPDFIRRFETEAQLIARLEHPFIVPLYDYWRELDGAFLVMRYLRGGSLRERLTRGALPLSEVSRLAEQIGAALAFAHHHRVVHRDLKPANILFDEEHNAYLTDFGIAKALLPSAHTTQEGALLGSPAYLTPEQWRSEPVTPATDIYTFGLLLYEALTGQHPFPADLTPTALMYKQLNEPLPSLQQTRPDLPAGLNDVMQRATAKDPAQRYPDALSVAAAFRQAIRLTRDIPEEEAAADARPQAPVPEEETIELRLSAPVNNPYKGLRAFQEADAADFFGREALTERLIARLGEDHPMARFLAVVGPSGSGKSSVVKAGLLPALRREAIPSSDCWFIAEMLPGSHPLDELEVALMHVASRQPPNLAEQLKRDKRGLARAAKMILPEDSELLLVIDQFEEVFMLTEDTSAARHFLDLIYAAVTDPRSQVRVIITLRADFYDRPLMIPDFSDLVRQRTEAVIPLTTAELEQAVIGPAGRAHVTVEPKLVTEVVHEVGEQLGVLPMLQYALTELFERRSDHTLTLDAYHLLGGVMGVLAKRADEVYRKLTDEQQVAARQIFLRLVTLGEGTEDTRRRTRQTELLSLGGDPVDAVLDAFGRSRLLTFDRDPATREPTVEVAHEAIIREWVLLKTWLDDSRADIRQQRMVATAAQDWQTAVRDRSYLLTGSRLAQFEGWAGQTDVALTPDERAYLDASITENQRQRTRRRRVRNIAFVTTAAVALIMTVLALFALGQRNDAREARDAAQNERNYARELALVNGAQAALAKGDPDTAIALAVAANRADHPSAQAQTVLSEAAYSPGTIRLFEERHAISPVSLVLTPDGRRAVSSSYDGTFKVWDIATGRVVYTALNETPGHLITVSLSPDGRFVLSLSEEEFGLWDIETGRLVRSFDDSQILKFLCRTAPVFSPDGQWAAGSNGGGLSGFSWCANDGEAELLIWEVATGQVIRTVQGDEYAIMGQAFSPDGSAILSVLSNGLLVLTDVETGETIRTFGETQDLSPGLSVSVVFSPDGKTALIASPSGTTILWDLTTYQEIRRFEAGSMLLWADLKLSQDGRLALVAGMEGATLWDVRTGAQLALIPGNVQNVALEPDGRTALLGYEDGSLREVDLYNGAQMARFPLERFGTYLPVMALSPDGRTFAACVEEVNLESYVEWCQVALFDAATGTEIRRIGPAGRQTWEIAFSPDGHRIVVASYVDKLADVWDVDTGQEVIRFPDVPASHAVFSPDSKTVLVSAQPGEEGDLLILWDVATGQQIRQFMGHGSLIGSMAFSPDGRVIAAGLQNNWLALWDVATGQELHLLDHGAEVGIITFSPDGKTLLSCGDNGQVILWDVATGQELRRFIGHTQSVSAVHFSPDGRWAFSYGGNGEGYIQWDVASGEAVRRYAAPTQGSTWNLHDFAVSPDGHSLFVSGISPDSAIYRYRIDTAEELLAWTLENRYVRDLTCEERAQYRIAPLCKQEETP